VEGNEVVLFSSLPDAPIGYLPWLIFVAEMIVVTLSTIRIIFVARGHKLLAPLVGLFEVSIWLFAIGQIMQNLTNIWYSVAFAGGFTIGNYFGLVIDETLAMGSVIIRIITSRDTTELIAAMKAADYGVTRVDAQGSTGPVQMVFTIVKRKDLGKVIDIIKTFDSKVFYSVTDLHSTAEGIFPLSQPRRRSLLPTFLQWRSRAIEPVPSEMA
jgi:uncharacterized protein YebE (UPF0316 family)